MKKWSLRPPMLTPKSVCRHGNCSFEASPFFLCLSISNHYSRVHSVLSGSQEVFRPFLLQSLLMLSTARDISAQIWQKVPPFTLHS